MYIERLFASEPACAHITRPVNSLMYGHVCVIVRLVIQPLLALLTPVTKMSRVFLHMLFEARSINIRFITVGTFSSAFAMKCWFSAPGARSSLRYRHRPGRLRLRPG